MPVKIGKNKPSKVTAAKTRKITARPKKINWDKYFGKIDFPTDAVTYQRKMRDEWAK